MIIENLLELYVGQQIYMTVTQVNVLTDIWILNSKMKHLKYLLDYDAILSHRYGNYMELPPKENRISHEPLAYVR